MHIIMIVERLDESLAVCSGCGIKSDGKGRLENSMGTVVDRESVLFEHVSRSSDMVKVEKYDDVSVVE